MRILDRYLLREIVPPFLLSLLIFTFILTLPPVMKQLEQLVAKGVSWDAAARIVLTLIPQGLGLTIPMATLTGILVALGRMSGDRETVALLATGVVLLVINRPRSYRIDPLADQGAVSIMPVVTPHGAGITAGFRF